MGNKLTAYTLNPYRGYRGLRGCRGCRGYRRYRGRTGLPTMEDCCLRDVSIVLLVLLLTEWVRQVGVAVGNKLAEAKAAIRGAPGSTQNPEPCTLNPVP